ncbi:hypothetical protein ACIBSW_06860 [Actinoplanes sp. NPDC049668]|uniref:hypothetical protein n=1 Tax=unclassified Actinoplanes TaxID=2626549 RepID=UPI0033B8E9DB
MTMAPAGLDKRGRKLWQDVTAAPGARFGPLELLLLAEACRTADRLERLDGVIRGKGNEWITLAAELEGRSEVAVVIDAALSEARQQQGRLTSIVAELRLRTTGPAAPTGKPAPAPPTAAEVPAGVSSIIGRAVRAGPGPRAG